MSKVMRYNRIGCQGPVSFPSGKTFLNNEKDSSVGKKSVEERYRPREEPV